MAARLQRAAALASLGGALRGPKGTRGQRLAKKLGTLHGLPQKVGQLLALGELERGDLVFQSLTDGGEAMPPARAKEALELALGGIDTHFKTLSLDGIAASLGQVHRGTLHDGTEVAVKLQYPGIAEAVRVDLGALGLIGKMYRRGYDLQSYRQTLGEMIERELDYHLEARGLECFRAFAAGDTAFAVPRLVPELSGERVLTMTWLDGLDLAHARQLPLEERRSASQSLIRWFLRSVLEWRHIHGDGHPGNLRFLPNGHGGMKLGVLDFGCVQALDASMASGMRSLIDSVVGDVSGPATHWMARYEAMGFAGDLLEPVSAELQALSRLLLAPLTVDAPFDVSAWAMNERVKLLLGDRRFAFRFAAPSQFVFVTRAFAGLIQTLKALNAPVHWRPIYEDVASRSSATPTESLVLKPAKSTTRKTLSQYLRVFVKRLNGTRIDLTFPAHAAENLSGLVPPEVSARLVERKIDVLAIEQKAVSENFAPGELFHLEEPERTMRVWLE